MHPSWFHMLLIVLGPPIGFIGSVFLFAWWWGAICPSCYHRSPDFVWSWGTASKHVCEKCCPNRIKEVFGSNENYLEHLYTKRSKQNV